MKRIGMIVCLLAVCFVFLTGCSKPASEAVGSAKKEETQEHPVTKLTYWTFVDWHAQHIEKMLKSWNEKNPDKQIEINVRAMAFDEMHNKLLLALQTGEGVPDIADIEIGEFPLFTNRNKILLEPLDDLMEPYRKDIVKSRLDIYRKDGVLYGFPTHVGATVAFYNTELLSKAGIDYRDIVTWEDFGEAGIELYEKTGKHMGMADTTSTWQASIFCAEQGSDLVDKDGNPQVNSDAMIRGYEMLRDFQEHNVVRATEGGQPDTDEAAGQLNQGNYGCVIMPLWYMSRFVDRVPNLKGKVAIAPLPVFEEGQPCSVGLGGTGTVVPKNTENAELAKEFAAFAKVSEEANIEIWNVLGFDPCNMSIWDKKEITHNPDNVFVQYFQNNPFDVLKELVKDKDIYSMRSVKAVPAINKVLCTETLNAIILEGKDVRQTLDEAQEAVLKRLNP